MFRYLAIVILLVLPLAVPTTGAEPTAYVINTSSENLSKIHLPTGVVTNNIEILGSDIQSYPSQITIRDSLAYVLLSGTAEIQIINVNTENTVGWVLLPPGSNPFWMAFADDSIAYVTLLLDNALVKVNMKSGDLLKTTPVGISPEGIVISGDRAYVAITAYDFGSYTWGQGKIAVYDIAADTVLGDYEILTPVNPQFMAIDYDGYLHCVCTGDYWANRGKVVIVMLSDMSVIDTLDMGGDPSLIGIGPEDIAFISAGGWADDGEVFTYRSRVGDLVIFHDASNPIYVDSGAMGIVTFQDSTAFACTFGDRVFRLRSDGTVTATYAMGDGPVHLDFNYQPGDANGDWGIDVGDAVYLINTVFKQGAAPVYPRWRGDANGDGAINVGDPVYLINYAFKGGPPPRCSLPWVH